MGRTLKTNSISYKKENNIQTQRCNLILHHGFSFIWYFLTFIVFSLQFLSDTAEFIHFD